MPKYLQMAKNVGRNVLINSHLLQLVGYPERSEPTKGFAPWFLRAAF